MKRILNIISLFAAMSLAASCVYDFNPEIEGLGGNLVIEGDILAGEMTIVQVSLSKPLSHKGEMNFVPFTSAKVYVESADGTCYNAYDDIDPDKYLDSPYFLIDTRSLPLDRQCRLVVKYKSNTYASQWLDILKAATIDTIGFHIADDRKTMDITVTSNGGSDTGYYRWVGREKWEYTADYAAYIYYDPATNQIKDYEDGQQLYYCWKRRLSNAIMIASTEELASEKLTDYTVATAGNTDDRYSYLYRLTLYQECITADAYNYWRSMRRNSADVGGLFSAQPSEIRGNIYNINDPSEYVLGFISASRPTVAEKYFNNGKHYFYNNKTTKEESVIAKPYRWSTCYKNGYLPYQMYFPPGVEEVDTTDEYEWLPKRCIDCRFKGGNKVPPKDWLYNHI